MATNKWRRRKCANIYPYEEAVGHTYMTLQLLHSEFSYIWGKLDFLFYHCKYCTKKSTCPYDRIRRYITEEFSVSLFLRISKIRLTLSNSWLVTKVHLSFSVVCDVCIYEQPVIEPSPRKLRNFYPVSVTREKVKLFFSFSSSDLKKHT